MHVFTTNDRLNHFLTPFYNSELVVGFVPTMGAIHKGHRALVRRSCDECDITIVSIFVNPTQFNDKTDLTKYPRPLASDIHELSSEGADVLYLPITDQVYPSEFQAVEFEIGSLGDVMEGPFRPGHFEGVVTVVHRLLEIVQPDRLYMGLKDYQQQAIIGHMIEQLKIPTVLVPCPIVREEDGLAFSSRNVRIDQDLRHRAPSIYQILTGAKDRLKLSSAEEVSRHGMQELESAGFRPEYFSLVDGKTLETVEEKENHRLIVACVAAWLGEVRLIDNLVLKGTLEESTT